MNLTKEQWKAAIAAMTFSAEDDDINQSIKAVAGEYVLATDKERRELLITVYSDIINALPELTKLRDNILAELDNK